MHIGKLLRRTNTDPNTDNAQVIALNRYYKACKGFTITVGTPHRSMMEKNPVFEFSQEEPVTSSHDNQVCATQQKLVKQQKLPCRVWAVVVVIAIFAVCLTVVSVAIAAIFKPSANESQSVSVSDIEALKQQVKDLKQLLNRKANSSHLMAEIRLRDRAIEDIKANLMETQSLQLSSNKEHQLQLNRSKLQTQEVLQQLNNSLREQLHISAKESQQQLNHSAQKIEKLQQQLNISILKQAGTEDFKQLHELVINSTRDLQQQLNSSAQTIQELKSQVSFNQALTIEISNVTTNLQNEFTEALIRLQNSTSYQNLYFNDSVEQLANRVSMSVKDIQALGVQVNNSNHAFQLDLLQLQTTLNISDEIGSLQLLYGDLNSSLAMSLKALKSEQIKFN